MDEELRVIARQLLQVRKIPIEYEDIIYNSDVPYELTIRKLLSGCNLNDALGIVEVADSAIQCKKCRSFKVLERSVQTRSADESSTSFYFCTKCRTHWKG